MFQKCICFSLGTTQNLWENFPKIENPRKGKKETETKLTSLTEIIIIFF